MHICKKLFYDINFEPDAVQPCCNVHGIRVPRFPFSGGKLDMASYAAHIVHVVDTLQDSASLVCKGCPELEEVDIGENARVNINFHTVSINMHRHQCNCRCVYCDLWRHDGSSYSILPALQSLWEQHVLYPQCSFSWGGGEPSILKEFEETSRWILENGYFQYVHTNALRHSPTVERLLREGRGAVNVSLDSASPDVYRAVKGINDFTRVVEHVRCYAAAACVPSLVHVKYIIFEKNNSLKEIARFLELCASLNVGVVQYSLNFKDLNSVGAQPKSLLGAAFFRRRAAELGLATEPFFIPPAALQAIEHMERAHFSDVTS
ncbi:MAG: radical SAM protein [Desulfovibrio sp.]|nr:radical SAM protein [Desulfovibrio sp.]